MLISACVGLCGYEFFFLFSAQEQKIDSCVCTKKEKRKNKRWKKEKETGTWEGIS